MTVMIAVKEEEEEDDEEEETESIKFDDGSRNAWEEPKFHESLYLTFAQPLLSKSPSKRGELFHVHCIKLIMVKVGSFKVNFAGQCWGDTRGRVDHRRHRCHCPLPDFPLRVRAFHCTRNESSFASLCDI